MRTIYGTPAMPIIHNAEPGDITPMIARDAATGPWLRLSFGDACLSLSIFGDNPAAIAERLGQDLIALAKDERDKQTKREG